MKRKKPSQRFAAKLLFQFRVLAPNAPGKRRICEYRILNFLSASGPTALAEANRRGIAAQYSYRNSAGRTVHFEFVGVQDLLCLDPECQPDEVWYDIVQLVRPMERKNKLIPKESELNALQSHERAAPLRP